MRRRIHVTYEEEDTRNERHQDVAKDKSTCATSSTYEEEDICHL